jgi:hypothetical protein
MIGRAPRQTVALPATYDDALAWQMLAYASERLKGARWGAEERQEANRLLLMEIADVSQRNCAYIVDLATAAGIADAYEAASELVSRRLAADQPLGASLEYFVNWLTLGRRPPDPEGRPSEWLFDLAILLLIIDLKVQFPGAYLNRSSSKRTSICAVVAKAVNETSIRLVTEHAIRQIYERHGPPALPAFRGGPKPGIVRFLAQA